MAETTGGNFENGFKTAAFKELCSEDARLTEYGKAFKPKSGEAYFLARKLDVHLGPFSFPLIYPFEHTGVYVNGVVYGLRPENEKLIGPARFDGDHPGGIPEDKLLSDYAVMNLPGLGDHFDGATMQEAVRDIQSGWDIQNNPSAPNYNLPIHNCHDASYATSQNYRQRLGIM